MIKTLTVHDFLREFANSDHTEQFSREALRYIFDNIEAREENSGVPTELSIVAICCEWSEDSCVAIAENYSIDISDLNDDDATQAVLEFLWCRVSADIVGDKIVYEQF